jgi:hypothetical protein
VRQSGILSDAGRIFSPKTFPAAFHLLKPCVAVINRMVAVDVHYLRMNVYSKAH